MIEQQKPGPLVKKPDRPFLGKAIVNGNLRFTSASQIATADPLSDGCNRRFAYQYVFGVKLAKTPSQLAGNVYAKDLETWLSRGEMILPPTLLEGKKFFPHPWNAKGELDLECEKPLGDMKKAVDLRDALLRGEIRGSLENHIEEIRKAAGVIAAGVPLEGAADYRHARQEYIDGDGNLRVESPNSYVVEIGDLKCVSQIDDRRIMKGKQAGEIRKGWAKTAAEVCKHPQMLSYGIHAADAYEGITHVRLSHVYCATQSKNASKRTGLVSVDEVRTRWAQRVEPLVRKMIQIAGAVKIEDVEAHIPSCDSYNHVSPVDGQTILRGCGYQYQCPRSTIQVAQSITNQIVGDAPMSEARSLFDVLAPDLDQVASAPSPPLPPSPPTPPQEYADQVALQKALLVAGEAPMPPAPPSPPGDDDDVEDDDAPSGDPMFNAILNASRGIQPPDAPKHASMLEAAGPVPAAAVAEIEDLTLRAAVEEHNRLHAERAAAMAAAAPKKAGGRCPGTGQVIQISVADAMRKKVTCPIPGCGVVKPIPKEVRDAQATSLPMPGHNIVKGDAVAVAVPQPPMPPASPAAPPSPPSPPMPPAPPSAPVVPQPPTPPAPPIPPAPPNVPAVAQSSNGVCTLDKAELDILSVLFSDKVALIPRGTLNEKTVNLLRRLHLLSA